MTKQQLRDKAASKLMHAVLYLDSRYGVREPSWTDDRFAAQLLCHLESIVTVSKLEHTTTKWWIE